MNEHWIRVQTSDGVFSDESNVSLTLSNGQNISLFVDNSLIKKVHGDSLLRVTLVKNMPAGRKLVLLPTEPFESYSSRWVEVLE
jgi:hypothetical protein